MSIRKVTIRYGTSLVPSFAKLIDVVPPKQSDWDQTLVFPETRLNNEKSLEKLKRPSLSAVLGVINDQKGLYMWQKGMIDEMGMAGFRKTMNERLVLGINVHKKVESLLKLRGEKNGDEAALVKLIDSEKDVLHRNYMKSALPIVLEIEKPEKAICEKSLQHPLLAYQGRFDAVVSYKNSWSILDWKTAPARSSFGKKGEDSISYITYTRQLAAYASAFNYDPKFCEAPLVKTGLLVSLKEDGAEADIFEINEEDMQKTFEELKPKMQELWEKIDKSTGPNLDFAYKPLD